MSSSRWCRSRKLVNAVGFPVQQHRTAASSLWLLFHNFPGNASSSCCLHSPFPWGSHGSLRSENSKNLVYSAICGVQIFRHHVWPSTGETALECLFISSCSDFLAAARRLSQCMWLCLVLDRFMLLILSANPSTALTVLLNSSEIYRFAKRYLIFGLYLMNPSPG